MKVTLNHIKFTPIKDDETKPKIKSNNICIKISDKEKAFYLACAKNKGYIHLSEFMRDVIRINFDNVPEKIF